MKLQFDPSTIDALQWRIDDRFDHYVRNLTGDGEVVLTGGAAVDDDGQYLFPAVAGKGGSSTACFSGSVEYKAYMGVLSLRISAPRITVGEHDLRLSVQDIASQGADVELATAPLVGRAPGMDPIEFRLTEAGSEMFFGKYPPGWLLAPAKLKVRKSKVVVL
ncbi:Htaa protein [Arthrobacter sp. cf158]|uniref:HtaA domain-containing protein n=1 Tax=Arthrobacter sp. cf158 TaxID=1761744 RepID=UPI0008974F3E|nr:HtaA domain-containing protein [Arthrobacter sp. cf158]SDW90924.1 Htaa protein [Arthrobacter sp. cf158]